jgi:hypothetical protein
MKKLFSFAIPTLLVAFGMTASATTLTFGSNPVIFLTTGGGGEFQGTLNPGGTAVDVYCVDDKDSFSANNTYTINVNTFIGSGNISQTRAGVLLDYEEAGYLTSLYNTGVTGGNDAIQDAIWSITGTLNSTTCDSNCVNEKNAAASNYASFMSDHTVTVYTDAQASCENVGTGTTSGCMQEFISTAPISSTPEPSSATLLGIGGGLIGLGALRLKKTAK